MRLRWWRGGSTVPGGHGRIDSRTLGAGAYTLEIPDVGAGHYVYDRSAACQIHNRRLEPWCDVCAEDQGVAREELHWHSLVLSQLEAPPDAIRDMGERMIGGRRDRLIAAAHGSLEAMMAECEGIVETAPARMESARGESDEARQRKEALEAKADGIRDKVREKRAQHDTLPSRFRLRVERKLVLGLSVGLFGFDVGILGSAFDLIPGELHWKIVMTGGIALAPVSAAICIAAWLSAAQHPVREGRAAGRLASLAGAVGVVGLLLIMLFRAAATRDQAVGWEAFSFLAFIQVSLAMAETMVYTVYFDSKVGVDLRDEIAALERFAAAVEARALAERERELRALARVEEIRNEAAVRSARLRREETVRAGASNEEEGVAEFLRAVVDSAILEGAVAAERRRRRKAEEALDEAEREIAPAWAMAMIVLVLAVLAALASHF